MKINFEDLKPVYLQIAEAIEDDILFGRLQEGQPAYSQLTISRELNVNPATAAKGINVLVQKGILEKQRGLSMVVAHGAATALLKEKKEEYFLNLINNLIHEAEKIKLSEEEVLEIIKGVYKNLEGRKRHE